jgi:hypothetical protein
MLIHGYRHKTLALDIIILSFYRDCWARLVGLKVVSFERSLLKGELLRFATGFDQPLSCERPFKGQRHFIQDFECNKLISTYCIYFW